MDTTRTPWQTLRKVFLWAIVASFSIAAIAGIAALLGADVSETGWRVIGSTVTVGAYGLAMLCCASLFDRPERFLGVAGVVVAVVSLGMSLAVIWSDGEWSWGFYQVLLTTITLTVAISFASLFLALTRHRDRLTAPLVVITLGLFIVATATVLYGVWEGPGYEEEIYGRVVGIVLILAVLGGVSTPVLSVLRSRQDTATNTPGDSPVTAVPSGAADHYTVLPQTLAALEAEAHRQGITVEKLVAPVLTAPTKGVERTAAPLG